MDAGVYLARGASRNALLGGPATSANLSIPRCQLLLTTVSRIAATSTIHVVSVASLTYCANIYLAVPYMRNLSLAGLHSVL